MGPHRKPGSGSALARATGPITAALSALTEDRSPEADRISFTFMGSAAQATLFCERIMEAGGVVQLELPTVLPPAYAVGDQVVIGVVKNLRSVDVVAVSRWILAHSEGTHIQVDGIEVEAPTTV